MARYTGFLSQDDPEMHAAWAIFPDYEMYNAEAEESLQYMGTIELEAQPGVYVHQFRHRAMPGTGQRHYWNIVASEGWRP